MSLLACLPALFILVTCFDRLRQVNWHNARRLTVLALLAQSWIGFWALYAAFAAKVPWWQWVLLLGVAAWLYFTRAEWREGVPLHVQTGAGELGPPELKP